MDTVPLAKTRFTTRTRWAWVFLMTLGTRSKMPWMKPSRAAEDVGKGFEALGNEMWSGMEQIGSAVDRFFTDGASGEFFSGMKMGMEMTAMIVFADQIELYEGLTARPPDMKKILIGAIGTAMDISGPAKLWKVGKALKKTRKMLETTKKMMRAKKGIFKAKKVRRQARTTLNVGIDEFNVALRKHDMASKKYARDLAEGSLRKTRSLVEDQLLH